MLTPSAYATIFLILFPIIFHYREVNLQYSIKYLIQILQITLTSLIKHPVMRTDSLSIKTFEPFPKNPSISKVFREMGLADELGSGMRNSYKFTKLYSGAEPEFIDGDIFKIIIPLTTGAMTKVGPGTDIETNTETVKNSAETSTEIRRCIYIYKDLDCNSLYSICRHRDTPFLIYEKRKRPASRSFSSKSLYLSCLSAFFYNIKHLSRCYYICSHRKML